jgi:Ni/Fe-hydrogenase subunit HybB-like protein
MILVIVGLSRATGRHLDDELIIWMGRRLLSIFIVVTFYVLLIENAHRAYLHYSREAGFFFLSGGVHSLMFWIGLIFIGCVVPALILFIKRTGTSVPWTVFASILVVIGVLFERFLIVIPGLIHPPELFPGWEISDTVLWEGVVSYNISYLEVLQTLGVIGIVGFAFVIGLKVMPLAPMEARALPPPTAAPAGD